MIKRLSACIREYKRDTILTPIFVIFEVAFDVLIPMMMAELIDKALRPEAWRTSCGTACCWW